MSRFVALLSAGISTGSIYALVALGFVTIYKATGVINFAQGDLATLGSYLAFWAVSSLELATGVAYALAIGLMFLVGVGLERITTAPLRGRSVHVVVIATLGAGMAIRAGLGIWQSSRPKRLPSPLGIRTVGLFGARIPYQSILIVAVTAMVVVALILLFERTQFGRQLRALATDTEAARLQGVMVGRMSMLSFGIAGALAGLAGVLFAPVVSVNLNLGFVAMLNGFAAAILGGFGRIGGVVVGALMIGVFEQMAAGYIAPQLREVYPFALMILVIAVRPQGLFGSEIRARH
ncbi:MAG: branched-chain amino acid ABC transporter permease [Ilumatobacteraceae bacterium]